MIDFRCSQCGKMLRTPDDAAGKQAQCPACGAVQPIPAASTVATPENPFQSVAGPAPVSDNPYLGAHYETTGAVAPRGEIARSHLDVGDTLSKSWAIAKPQILAIFVFGLVYFGISFLAGFVLQIAAQGMASAAKLGQLETELFTGIGVQIPSQLLSIFLSIGAVIYMLKMARGEQASLMDLVAGMPYMLRTIGGSIVLGVACAIGLGICLLPGLIAGAATNFNGPVPIIAFILGGLVAVIGILLIVLTFGQFLYVVVDRNVGVFQAFAISREITRGNRFMLFMIYLLGSVFGMIGMCALCLPYFFAVAFMFLMLSVAYLTMSGQPVAAPSPAYVPPTNPQNLPGAMPG